MGFVDYRHTNMWDRTRNDWNYEVTVPMYASGNLGGDLTCIDCTRDTSTNGMSEVYMVTTDAWTAAGMGAQDGCLCVGCLETRIGRRLRPHDFPTQTMNDIKSLRRSRRLASRMGVPRRP